MTDRDDDRTGDGGLRGSLAEILFPSLIDGAREALAKRFGPKASLDAPGVGRVTGLGPLERALGALEADLAAKKAKWAATCFVAGFDRDVACGELSLPGGALVPVAVVGERRPAREIEVRVYQEANARGRIVPPSTTLLLPRTVADVMNALKAGNAESAAGFFEESSVLHDAKGGEHPKRTGELERYLAKLAEGGLDVERGGSADDGRRAAFECSLVRAWGEARDHDAALFVFERGDSGLFATARVFA